mgnify:CR=1 FL=1
MSGSMRKLNATQKKLLKEAYRKEKENGKRTVRIGDLDYWNVLIPICNIYPFENFDVRVEEYFEELRQKGI